MRAPLSLRRHLNGAQKQALNAVLRTVVTEVIAHPVTGEEARIGMGQTQRAVALGVDAATVRRWDQDAPAPSANALAADPGPGIRSCARVGTPGGRDTDDRESRKDRAFPLCARGRITDSLRWWRNPMTTCPIDARPLARPPTGRPPTFCSVACRRVAEAELRRIDRRLAGLETDRDDEILNIATETYTPAVKGRRQRLAALEAAITTATERQRLLYARLADTEEETTDG